MARTAFHDANNRTQHRIAILGAGKMARHHARAIQRIPGVQLVAVADPTRAALELFGQVAPEVAVYSDFDTLFSAEHPDVVHVCTPLATHAALAKMALNRGAHVYVEKPFVESVVTAEQIIESACSASRRVCSGHQLLFEAPARRAIDLVPALGRIVHVESYFSFRASRRSSDGRIPLPSDLQLLDILPHPVYLLLHFLKSATQGVSTLTALDLGPGGTIHAQVQRGNVTGTMVVSLEARPIESYVRVVGTNGVIAADFVRGIVLRQIGPGTSGIDKVLAPYRTVSQLLFGTSWALAERFLKKQRSYPGLVEIFRAFYDEIRGAGAQPVTPDSILETTRIWERVQQAIREEGDRSPAEGVRPQTQVVAVTGGTGLLGREVAAVLVGRGHRVRVICRRRPAQWERLPGVEYVLADLGQPFGREVLDEVQTVIHCAAETAGGKQEHQRNSIGSVEHVLRAAAAAGAQRLLHVSSLSVLAGGERDSPLSEESPLEKDGQALGPYAWGKLESERTAVLLGRQLGLQVKVVRPSALVDYRDFDPPGRLGRRLGNLFVAVGLPNERLGVVGLEFAARTLVWIHEHFEEAPAILNVIDPERPRKRELVALLRRNNPDLTVLWLPMFVLVPLSWAAMALQRILRPGTPAINVAKVFAERHYDSRRITALARRILADNRPDATAN
jgi:predicted dehydrogenase/nucleoside-diphosphate-sugar epimerase